MAMRAVFPETPVCMHGVVRTCTRQRMLCHSNDDHAVSQPAISLDAVPPCNEGFVLRTSPVHPTQGGAEKNTSPNRCSDDPMHGPSAHNNKQMLPPELNPPLFATNHSNRLRRLVCRQRGTSVIRLRESESSGYIFKERKLGKPNALGYRK
jgi:hypothetical protein